MTFNNSVNNLFGGQKLVSSATNYTVLDDDVIVNITDTSAARTVTLPSPNSTNIGKFFIIKDSSGGAETNNITISSASGTIDGSTNYIIESNYGSVILYSDGVNYLILPFERRGERPLEYVHATKTTTQTITGSGSILTWQTTFGTMTPVSTTNFRLTGGRTYSLESAVRGIQWGTAAGAWIQTRWVDTANVELPNQARSLNYSLRATVNTASTIPSMNSVIYTPTVTEEVRVHAIRITGTTRNVRVNQTYSWAKITELR